jgi:hypothetical protein
MSLISLTEDSIFTTLCTVLQTFGLTNADGSPLSTSQILQGQVNRVPEPQTPDFVLMWPLMRNRLATNIDTWLDNTFTGSITANVLTVTVVEKGSVVQGLPIYGAGIATGCKVIAQLSGTAGGIGTYSVTSTPNVGSEAIYGGEYDAEQYTEMVVQCDVHGPASGDNAQRISTLMRDMYGVQAFQNAQDGVDGVTPLFADDPRQLPFINAEQQWEERWAIDMHLQVNIELTLTQQFAASLTVGVINVEATYPP